MSVSKLRLPRSSYETYSQHQTAPRVLPDLSIALQRGALEIRPATREPTSREGEGIAQAGREPEPTAEGSCLER